ncbi:MAG: F-box protein [Alphaproteobacteria bacterium]
MSSKLNLIFLKLAFIAIVIPHLSFAGKEELGASNETTTQDRVPSVKTLAFFDSLPTEIVDMILQKLPKTDLKNIRLTNKRLNLIATKYFQDIRIVDRLLDEDFQLSQAFFENLKVINVRFCNMPSVDFFKQFSSLHVNAFQKINLMGVAKNVVQTLALYLPATLQELDLGGNLIGDEGAKALGPYLPKTLKKLSVTNNYIADEGSKMLVMHLPASIQELDFAYNHITDTGVEKLAPHLPAALQRFDLRCNIITGTGVEKLAPHLPAALQRLDLSFNSITDAGMEKLRFIRLQLFKGLI